ncbi:sensor histidine kinase [Desulfovibrio ferrophilus]|uniref:histidine kinase n=1 Tax=Desulfovibrio ferrophilus TaxID=241368 RepID=A0A2Z6AYA3_9BACT|nr:PAS domain-containing sensor histidine kinase [Desulfovibrio ferrophilus]BBD08155.1 integral membrane sensor signal transduction histidine kinase [Desulfovibrio ferrophilus]
MIKLNRKYAILRLKLMGITLCFALIPLVALGQFIHSQFSSTYQDKITCNLKLMVENKRDAIEMFLEERVSQLKNMAYSHSLESISNHSKLARIFEIIQSNSGSFIDLGIVDNTGRHVAYAGPYPLHDVNYSHEAWFHEVMLKGVFISDVFMGFRNFPHFIIAVRRQEGERSWILRATIDSDVFTSLVRSVQVGRKGDAFLVNSGQILQTPSRFAENVLSVASVSVPVVDPGQGVNFMEWMDGRDIMIAGVTNVPATGWRLVVAESPTEEMSPLIKTQSITLGLLGLGVLTILGGSYLSTGSVITKLMQAEKEKALLDASVVQSSKMASLGKLAAGVAHEINNPLTIIRESAGWMRDVISDGELGESKIVEELAQAVDDIDRHVERAGKVTHRMLGFARRMEPLQENVDINALTRQTFAFLESEALHRGIEIVFNLDEALPGVTTDANQVQQVILNLMENAIDAMTQDGVLTLHTYRMGKAVALSVQDTGVGISEENLPKVFDPFFTTKAVGEGTGLGLSIIYSTIQRLGGEVTVASKLGQGSEFTITLPAAETDEAL